MHHKDRHQSSSISSQSSQTTGAGKDNNKKDVAEEDLTTINKKLVALQEYVWDAISLDTVEETAPSILGNRASQWPQESTMDNDKCKLNLQALLTHGVDLINAIRAAQRILQGGISFQ